MNSVGLELAIQTSLLREILAQLEISKGREDLMIQLIKQEIELLRVMAHVAADVTNEQRADPDGVKCEYTVTMRRRT